ncbi:hypothetical protein AVEN_235382-1 [Araneus ventricosus]|uniref:Uncharacterized protein n=1 Tax=Araneus ventricosus TaxID=182803 RepID=A0A4Y2A4G1_ARAVE|nr:hypothetical protein AVEN_235382-1 [Araneus ventricosus]
MYSLEPSAYLNSVSRCFRSSAGLIDFLKQSRQHKRRELNGFNPPHSDGVRLIYMKVHHMDICNKFQMIGNHLKFSAINGEERKQPSTTLDTEIQYA